MPSLIILCSFTWLSVTHPPKSTQSIGQICSGGSRDRELCEQTFSRANLWFHPLRVLFCLFFIPAFLFFFFHEQRITGWQHQCKTKQSKRWSAKWNLSSDIFSICILSRTRQRKQMLWLVCLLCLAAMLLCMYINDWIGISFNAGAECMCMSMVSRQLTAVNKECSSATFTEEETPWYKACFFYQRCFEKWVLLEIAELLAIIHNPCRHNGNGLYSWAEKSY